MTSQTGSRECKQRTISGRRRPALRGGGDLGTKQIIDAALARMPFWFRRLWVGATRWAKFCSRFWPCWHAGLDGAASDSARPTWRWTPAMALVPAGAALLTINLTPLPQTFWPGFRRTRLESCPFGPRWETPQRLGIWNTISLAPAETRADLAIFLAYGLLS